MNKAAQRTIVAALDRIANALEIANGLAAEASGLTSERQSYVIEWNDELHSEPVDPDGAAQESGS